MSLDLSVIIPAYNSQNTIKECINSVVSECVESNITYEVLIIDDGSKDQTVMRVKELQAENANIKIISQENAGPSAARNHGLKIAQGNLIAFNDSDDIWLKGKLKTQLQYLKENPHVDLICSQYGDTDRSSTPIKITPKMELFHNYFVVQTCIIKKSVSESKKFPVDMKYSEDMRFFVDVLKDYNCYYYPVPATTSISGKRQFGETGLSANLNKMYKGEVSNLRFLYKNTQISFITYLGAVLYSVAKFLRRKIISIKK